MSEDVDERLALILNNSSNTYKMRELNNEEVREFKHNGKIFVLNPAKKFEKIERNWKKLGLSKTVQNFWIYLIKNESNGRIKPLDWVTIKDKMEYKKMSPFEMKQIVESDLERELEGGLKTPSEKLAGKKMFLIFAIVAIAVVIVYYSGVI